MAVSLASLRAQRPEFVPTADGVVQAAIDDAVTEVDPRVFGEKADQAVSLLAAHKAAISPHGKMARLDPKAQGDGPHGQTVYGVEYDALVRQFSTVPMPADEVYETGRRQIQQLDEEMRPLALRLTGTDAYLAECSALWNQPVANPTMVR